MWNINLKNPIKVDEILPQAAVQTEERDPDGDP